MLNQHELEFVTDRERLLQAAGVQALHDRIDNLASVNAQIRAESTHLNGKLDYKRLDTYYLLERVIKNLSIKKRARLWLYQNLIVLIEPNPAELDHFEKLLKEFEVVTSNNDYTDPEDPSA